MPLVTQTFNHKTLMRIAIVMAFVQFTNALEYMALTPVFAFMADGFSVPVSFLAMSPVCIRWVRYFLESWPFIG